MKKYRITYFLLVATIIIFDLKSDVQPFLLLLDQIEVVVFGKEDVEIITKSDIDRPALGGGYRSQDDIIFERSVLLDAKQHKIPNDEETVDAGIEQMMREHNLSQDDLEAIFNASGYTLQEGRE